MSPDFQRSSRRGSSCGRFAFIGNSVFGRLTVFFRSATGVSILFPGGNPMVTRRVWGEAACPRLRRGEVYSVRKCAETAVGVDPVPLDQVVAAAQLDVCERTVADLVSGTESPGTLVR